MKWNLMDFFSQIKQLSFSFVQINRSGNHTLTVDSGSIDFAKDELIYCSVRVICKCWNLKEGINDPT